MTDSLNNIRNSLLQSAQQTTPVTQRNVQRGNKNQVLGTGFRSFEEVLNSSLKEERPAQLKFSKHASERLSSRNIDLSNAQLERLENGVSKAHLKGINESLVMVDDVAFIVNIKNNTVVTAVSDMDEQVFTNIDGAVIA